MVKNLKNCRIVDLDSSKEGFSCTECNAKNLSSLQSTISEKIKKNRPKWSKMVKMVKIDHFCRSFLIFSETVLCRELRFLALHSVHQNPSFELSKSTIRQFFRFFTIRGDPCDLGGVKFYRHSFARSKIENKNSFGIRRTSLTPWHMEEIISVCLVANLICLIKPFWGGTAYLTIVEIYQTWPVNYLMGGFRCEE